MNEKNELLEEDLHEEKEDFTQESTIHYHGIRRKVATSIVCYGVILFTLLFKRYEDFNVALSSYVFIILLFVSILATVYMIYTMRSNRLRLDEKQISNYLKKHNDIYDIIAVIPVFIATIAFLNALVISPASVVKTSMEPNYYEGDDILVYHFFESYDRYDVVIVKVDEENYYIKRIIGLPGETVTIKDGEVYIDGVLLDDPTPLKLGAGTYCKVGHSIDFSEECTFTVPQDEYFVLGDNREASVDSRSTTLGYIEKEQLYGKVIIKLGFLN